MIRSSRPEWAVVLVGTVVLSVGCGGSVPDAGDVSAGRQVYRDNCAMCHGPSAEGMPGLGKSLRNSEFVRTQTDAELVEFFAVGRSAEHPLNERGIPMPPRGGNPALTDADLATIAAYVRSLQ